MVDEKVSISVVIPCFNDGQFLPEALASVFAQEFPASETLIINDGSTDRQTLRLLRTIDAPNLRVIHQDNRGLGGARNTGIQSSKGRYIYFLDADNVLHPDCLSKLTQLMEEHSDAVAAACRIKISGGPMNGMEWADPCNPYWLLVHNQWDAGIMLRKEAVEKYNLFYDNTRRCHGYEDWEFHIRLARTGKPILFYPAPLYQYRIRDNSLLGDARKHYVEILNYIRDKHKDLYAAEQLITFKRSHAPALILGGSPSKQIELERELESQTFKDWGWFANSNGAVDPAPYKFYYSTIESIRRLPVEALESAIMALEANPRARHCLIGVKQDTISWLANRGKNLPTQHVAEPLAVVVRNKFAEHNIQDILSSCELFIELPDQRPDIRSAWDSTHLKVSDDILWNAKDILAVRKRLSVLGAKLLGENIHRRCLSWYDHLYGRLVSERSLKFRAVLRRHIGKRGEQLLSKAVYGLFLMKPPTEEDSFNWEHLQSSVMGSAPLFLKANRGNKINILIVTSWFNEGGVEQIILDLCRLLDPSRFKVTIVTTLPSRHTWDYLARRRGAFVYHLADLLNPTAIAKGLLHLILNQPADCLYIIHSRAAYESLRLFKRIAPWLSITDRNEVVDPGGGFPLLSAQAGNNGINVRTVGHKKLADYMATEYQLSRNNLQVIYAGTDMGRIQNSLSKRRGRLHAMCQVSPDTPIVTFIGRFTTQKRPEVFIRSVAKCLEMKPESDAHFAMIGDGEFRSAVEHLIEKAGLKKQIHLLGAQTNAIDLLADSTVFMMPSAYEGLALVSYEAMALGVPQIFANVNGQSELITSDTGILIDNGPGEDTRYAQACLELLSDPERRAHMATAGKERIKTYFTAENAVKQYAGIFEELAELSRKRASEIPHLRPPHINPLHQLA
jgi:glycosyltransferase involved in cell wall biosynthesis/GT2 family glycosyltransferase